MENFNKRKKERDYSYKKNLYFPGKKLFKNYNIKIFRKNKSRERLPILKLDFENKIILKYRKVDKDKLKTITITKKDDKDEKVEKIQYIEEGILGKGGFGICYKYESTKDWNLYAAKIIDKKNIIKKDKNRQSIKAEIETQQECDHPKIVKVKSYSEDKDNVYIILELCQNKSLAELLDKRGFLTEFEVRNYIFQLIQGVKYLHSKKIIHRDLKPNNLLLDNNLELKIGDFGLIAKLTKEKERKTSVCGTPCFMAPELIKPPAKGYSFEVDIWSIGIIMYNLLTGKLPFNDNSPDKETKIKNIYYKILNHRNITFPENNGIFGEPILSEASKDLIEQILVKDPKKRPGLNQILYHDFFHIGKFPRYLKK